MQYFLFDGSIPKLNLEIGKRYKVQEVEDERTLQQIRGLFGVYYPQVIEAFARKGKILNKEKVHFFFKTQFLRKRRKCAVTGRYKFEDGTTVGMTRKQYSKFIEDIKKWTYDVLDFVLQDPVNNEELAWYDENMQ